MAWAKAKIVVRDDSIDGLVKRGETMEVTIPWRAGVAKGAEIAIDGEPHKVVAIHDPGNRHEILELGIEVAPAAKPDAHPAKTRKAADKAGERDGS